jgi:low temperature requirement protein LtrA
MNTLRFRRNVIIIMGMVILNICTQVFVRVKGVDSIVVCSYFSLNSIWIYLVYFGFKETVDAIDKHLKDKSF